jgi:hypothetical protein
MTKSINVSIDVSKHRNKSYLTWDDAIRDARAEIVALRRQQKRFEQAIRIFRLNKQQGVPWPGTKTTAG